MNFRPRESMEKPGFQLAPMIDIIFLLLCFFVTSQIYSQWETEIDIKLPSSETGAAPQRLPGEIIINIRSDGTVVVNRQELDDAALSGKLAEVVRYFPGQPVLIRADKATDYEHLIRVLDLCRKADVWNISFAVGGAEKQPPR